MEQLSTEFDVRKNKIEELKKMGEIPYKEKFERTCTIKRSTRKTWRKS